jgi:hypothetical protein
VHAQTCLDNLRPGEPFGSVLPIGTSRRGTSDQVCARVRSAMREGQREQERRCRLVRADEGLKAQVESARVDRLLDYLEVEI